MQDLWIVDFIPKATGSQWRICKKKVKRLDLFFRAQSAVCGSCVYLLTHARLFATLLMEACQLLYPWNSPGKNAGVGSHSLLLFYFFIQYLCQYWISFSKLIYFAYVGSSLLWVGFLSCSAGASQCSGFSCFGAQALESMGFHSYGSWTLGHRLSSCGPWA